MGEIIHDAYKDDRFNNTIDQQTGYTTKNIVCAPVRTVRGDVIGVIQILNKRRGRFTKDDLDILEAITLAGCCVAPKCSRRRGNAQKSRKGNGIP